MTLKKLQNQVNLNVTEEKKLQSREKQEVISRNDAWCSNDEVNQMTKSIKWRSQSNDEVNQMTKSIKWRSQSNDEVNQMTKSIKWWSQSNDEVNQMMKSIKWWSQSNDEVNQMTKSIKWRSQSNDSPKTVQQLFFYSLHFVAEKAISTFFIQISYYNLS